MSTETMPSVEIKYPCYKCGLHISVSADAVGDVLPCPDCGADMRVPDSARAAALMRGENPLPTKAWNETVRAHCQNADLEVEAMKVKERAGMIQWAAIAAFIFGLVALVGAVGGDSVKFEPVILGGALFSFGLCLTMVAQLMHVRAAVLLSAGKN